MSSKTIAKADLRPEESAEGCRREGPVPRPVLGPFLEKIEELLEGKDWAREKGRRAVRRTSRWIFRRIQKEGFQGAESTVRAYVREKFQSRGRPVRSSAGREMRCHSTLGSVRSRWAAR